MPKIKELPSEDCPREKALLKGINSLTLSELFAVILGSGTKNKNVIEVSQELINSFNTKSDLLNANLYDLTKIKGIGSINSLKVLASLEIAKRFQKLFNKTFKLKNYDSKLVFDTYFYDFYNLLSEQLLIILLNRSGEIIHEHNYISLNEETLLIDFRILLNLLNKNVSKVILIHNHLNNEIYPSNADIEFTYLFEKELNKRQIKLLDHLIISKEKYFSFYDHKCLNLNWQNYLFCVIS